MEPELRVHGVRSAGRGRDLRMEHRHADRWVEMIPERPELSDDVPRRWRTRYVCRCGVVADSIVPS